METNGDNEYRIRSVNRAAKLLKCFTMEKRELSLNELSASVGLHKSTVHRIVKTLEEEEMLVRNPFKETYTLGMALFQLGNIVRDSIELRAIALPVMEKLAHVVRESVFLSVLSGKQKICIEKVEGPQGLRPTIKVGQVMPAHVGSSGKALLAYLDETELEAIIAEIGLPAFTEKTITNPQDLRKELYLIRRTGYAVGFEERTVGGAGVSSPIWGEAGKVIASLSVIGPTERIRGMGVDKIAGLVFDSARNISNMLGGSQFVQQDFVNKGDDVSF